MQSYDAATFPRPAAPALPVPSARSFALRTTPGPIGVWQRDGCVATYSGRYALALALAHAGCGAGDRVLLPAYHCLAMVEPLRQAGLMPVFYPIQTDTTVDLEVIARLGQGGAKVLVFVHCFGFVQDLAPLRQVADRLGMVLIEDCAHAWCGQAGGLPVGSVGDYAIASTLKFLPLGSGGLLASARRDLSDIRLRPPPLRIEFKAAVNLLEQALEYHRLGHAGRVIAGLLGLRDRFRRLLRRMYPAGRALTGTTTPTPTPEFAMDPRWLEWSGTRGSALLLRHARTTDLVARRRGYYRAYLDLVTGRDDCRPLFDPLPAGVAPQVFPLYVEHCLAVFVTLKREGVPIIRFGEFLDPQVTPELCPVSIDYAEHLLQFPCHQELSEAEAAWIRGRLIAALDQAAMGDGLTGPFPTAPPPERRQWSHL